MKKGFKKIGGHQMFEMIREYTNNKEIIKYNNFCTIVDLLELDDQNDFIRLIEDYIPEPRSNPNFRISRYENDINNIVTDYTSHSDLLFIHDSEKYYGNKHIVYNSINYLREIKDMVDFSQCITLPGSYSKHIKPYDFINFMKLIDAFPTNKLSINEIENDIIAYFRDIKQSQELEQELGQEPELEKGQYQNLEQSLEQEQDLEQSPEISALIDSPYMQEIYTRYQLRMMYLYLSVMKTQKVKKKSSGSILPISD